jgi:uncharacterized protein (TIGR02145 family)
MAENLNYNASGSKCYGEGGIVYKDEIRITLSSSEIQANCDKYGRLYNWSTAMKACPKGWHLPNNAEWDKLYRYADGTSGTESPYESTTAGKYLKSKEGWKDNGNGLDVFGFSALPGGFGNSGDDFGNVDDSGSWWSASESSSLGAYFRYMYYSHERAIYNNVINDYLNSVRCVRN